MSKWFGYIGYGHTVETAPSVWTEKIVEVREYYGDILRNARRLQTSSEKLNDDILITNQISIVCDPYAMENFCSMRYATFMGTKWKITDVEVSYPRMTLTLGGVYHEQIGS